jgi:hypothetical protein
MKVEMSFATPLRVIFAQQESGPGSRALFTFSFASYTFKGEFMSATMQVGTYATVSVEWKDKGGNVVGVEKGTAKWQSSDPATVQCEQATGNPQIANLYAPGPIGKVQVQASGDADLGEGVKTVTATIDVEVISGEAVSGEIKFTQYPQQGGQQAPPESARRK